MRNSSFETAWFLDLAVVSIKRLSLGWDQADRLE
jgi:hypothetical protein